MESNKFRLGLFIILSFIMLIMLFIMLGMCDYGKEKALMSTYLSESVQGLEVGSFVKFRGVPVGKVKDITISVSENDRLIKIDMEIDISKINARSADNNKKEDLNSVKFYDFILQESKRGLSAFLEMNGITGGKYIEFDYFPVEIEKRTNSINVTAFNSYGEFIVQSRPSTFTKLKENVTDAIAKISSIDYNGISEQMKLVIENTNKLLTSPALPNLVTKVDTLAQNINVKIEEAKIKETTEAIRRIIFSFDSTLIQTQSTIAKVNDSLDAMNEFLRMLEENPQVILSGKEKKKK